MYKCRSCRMQGLQEKRGCVRPVDVTLWQLTFCPACGGENEQCPECNGSNIVQMHRCPRALANDANVSMLLPFFGDYQKLHIYPDGRGRLYQPVKLIQAFGILGNHVDKHK